MSPVILLITILIYFALLIIISWITGKKADNETFFRGNRKSPWFVVAYAMIGTSISGVTFVSVPGWVGTSQFSYLQMVLGYFLGYMVILSVLMPVYYRMNLTSIYTYLEERFGKWSYKTGVWVFLISRTFGSAARLYLMAIVLYITILQKWNISFTLTVLITIFIIWLITYKGGIKTVIWTDSLQTTFFLVAVVLTLLLIGKSMNMNFPAIVKAVVKSDYSKVFFFDNWTEKHFFWKHFLGGAFIAMTMTGLDQDQMQKNLSCRSLRDAQKNMFWFSLTLIPVNILFLSLGTILYLYANSTGIVIPAKSDDLYPMIATGGYLSPFLGLCFIIGIIAAAYSSADSALTALTTSFSVDILGIQKLDNESQKIKIRKRVHIGYAFVLFLVIMGFRALNSTSVIDAIFIVAGYTYGPLLGLFSFGLLTKRQLKDGWEIPLVVILAPLICYVINYFSPVLFNGYKFGYELIILNGLITFTGLGIFSKASANNAGAVIS